jgi:hypothetical protein
MLELGGLMIAGVVLLVSILVPIFRRAAASGRQAMPRWAEEFLTLGIVATLAFGVAFLVSGAADIVQREASWAHLPLLLALLVGVVVLGRWLRVRTASTAPVPSAPASPHHAA